MSTSFLFGYFDNTFFNYQWSILNPNVNINLLPAWNITTGSKDVKIAIIDNGIDNYHPDLEVNILDGVDVVADEEYPSFVINGQYESDYDFHGTCCAGIIGAANNEIGIIGVAQTSKILSIRASHTVTYYSKALPPDTGSHHSINYEIRTSTKWLGDAFLCAHSICDADVVSCSMGLMYKPSEYVDNSIYEISHQGRQGKGIVIAISAGNTYDLPSIPYRDTLNFLSKNPNVISVGSINPCGKRVTLGQSCENNSIYNSCYGDSLDVVAPGISIPTTMINETFHLNFSGTSSAAPHVAGQAALILSVNPCLTREKVKYIIESTCTKISSDEYIYTNNENHPNGTWNIEVGYGLINVNDALLLAEQMGNYAYRNDTIIQTNYVWDENVRIDKDLVIDTLSMLLITDTLYISPTARIIVRPGGRLIVDGGTLTSACDDGMWEGITVEGNAAMPQTATAQGTVELRNGAVIENARCGLMVGAPDDTHFSSSGGVVLAQDAHFRNCLRAVEYRPYAYSTPSGESSNSGSFTSCSFTTDNAAVLETSGDCTPSQVRLWGVNGIDFRGCTFANTAGGTSGSCGCGIRAEDAGFSIDTYCPAGIYLGDCTCEPSHASYCTFQGFDKAVEANTTGSQYAVLINQARFTGNGTGVEVNGNNYTTVTRCDFDLTQVPSLCTSATGLKLSGSTGFLVEENTFHRTANGLQPATYGVQVSNSGYSDNSLYRNQFSNLTNGVYITGTNGTKTKGLSVTCGAFSGNARDIHLASGATVARSFGSSLMGADNDFSHTSASSISCAGLQSLNYYYSASTGHVPYNPSLSVTTYATAAANGCQSTLCADGREQQPRDLSAAGAHAQLSDNHGNTALSADRNVRLAMGDTVLDLDLLADWYEAVSEPSAKYALAETRFQQNTDNASVFSTIETEYLATDEDKAEYDNFRAFDALKKALALSSDNRSADWPAATSGQIAELQRIAEARTGRSSVMAQGVLCFFFDLCSDDFLESEQISDTRSAEASSVQPSGNGLVVSPNPTEGVLRVEGDGDIASVELYDTFGRLLLTQQADGPLCILDIAGLNDGAYLLKVHFANGTVNSCKVVKK